MLISWGGGKATIVPGREMGAFSGRRGGNEPLEDDCGLYGLGKVLRSQLAETWRTIELVAVLSPWLKICPIRIRSDRMREKLRRFKPTGKAVGNQKKPTCPL